MTVTVTVRFSVPYGVVCKKKIIKKEGDGVVPSTGFPASLGPRVD